MSQYGQYISLAGGLMVHTLTGDAGGAINPVAGNINLLGGTNIATVGTPGTITFNLDGTTDHAIQVGNAGGSISSLAVGTNGVILTGVTGANPTWTTATYPATINKGEVLCATANNVIGVVSGTGNLGQVLTSNGAAAVPTWEYVTAMVYTREPGNAVAMAEDNGYVPTNVGLTTFTLPVTADLGTTIEILGESAAGWVIAQNAGQNIQYGNTSTTPGVGGSIASSNRYDTITLKCRVADTTWSVVSSTGVLNVV